MTYRYYLASDDSEHGGVCGDLRDIWRSFGLKNGYRFDGVSSWDPHFARIIVRDWFAMKQPTHIVFDVPFQSQSSHEEEGRR